MIKALEEGRPEEGLGRTYVKSFLKSYASFLDLNTEDILKKYFPQNKPEQQKLPAVEKKENPPVDTTKLMKYLIIAAGAVVGLFIFIFVVAKIGNFYKDMVIKHRKIAAERRSAAVKKAVPEKQFVPIPRNDTINLTVSTSSDVWLKVMLDGKTAFHKILPADSTETWQGGKEILLTEIGKPEALKISVNGKNIDVPKGHLGKEVLITREGLTFEPK